MNRDLAVVTGAARGIGRAIAERLGEDGYRLLLLDILPDVLRAVEELPDADARVIDVREHAAIVQLFAELVPGTRLAVLVNCAGTCSRSGFEETSPVEWQRDLDTNLTGTFFTSQAAVFPYMRDQGYGRIINIASASGKLGGVGAIAGAERSGRRAGPAYAASKAGVINLTRWIAREAGRWNITCNAVVPGPIATAMTTGHEEVYPLDAAPIARFGRPREVADAVAYLAHPDRGYTTGACLHVDGGLVLA